jgi:hypothetical protein
MSYLGSCYVSGCCGFIFVDVSEIEEIEGKRQIWREPVWTYREMTGVK